MQKSAEILSVEFDESSQSEQVCVTNTKIKKPSNVRTLNPTFHSPISSPPPPRYPQFGFFLFLNFIQMDSFHMYFLFS